MVKRLENDVLDAVFSALADPTRRAILEQLSNGKCTVSELAEPHDMSLPAISKHLRVLEDAGLLTREIDGRIHRLQLNGKPMREAVAWLDYYKAFWEKRFESLDKFLQEKK